MVVYRALQASYRRLAEQKRAQVAASLAAARKAGLDWPAFVKWSAEHNSLRRKAGCSTALEPSDILRMTATQLLRAMSEGLLTSEYVTRCLVARTMRVDAIINCVTEHDYQRAVEEARACDMERANGRLRGPLHGLPISVKEQMRMAGFQTTCGTCCRLRVSPSNDSATLVQLARQAGAIPFARTNVPQLLMLPESFNAIYGTTLNPHDPARSPGGSTGGESALIAAHGSPLGLGTDVGGSIRLPAFMTGIVGFKPTVDRLSYKGIAVPRLNDLDGQREIRSAPGPMARSVADLELMMSVWCQQSMYDMDSSIPPVAWDRSTFLTTTHRGQQNQRPLRIGFYESDGWFQPAPACARAVRTAADAFRALGHEVVSFPLDEAAEAAPLYVSLLASQGGFRGFLSGIEGEALHPNYAFLYNVASLPNWLRPMIAWVLANLLGQERKSKLVRVGGGKSVHEYWQVIAERERLKKRLTERFEAAGLDVLICPGFGLPALLHNASVTLNQAASYTFVWNLFNWPAGTVPVTQVREDEQWYDANGDASFEHAASKNVHRSQGLPVGVQVIAQPWRDEVCLGAMKILEEALGSQARVELSGELALKHQ